MSSGQRLGVGLVLAASLALGLATVGQAVGPGPAGLLQATPTPYDVLIVPEGLRPPILAVPEGAAVRWTNQTEQVHSTTHVPDVGQPVEWASGDIQPGAQFTHTFKTTGIFNYLDARYADDVTFQGAVVVKRYEPTPTPLTPTVGPSPTTGPTITPPLPTATLPPTPTRPAPTRVPVALVGWLERADDPLCGIDALLRPCGGTGAPVPVRSDGALDPALFGREVGLEGVMTHCPDRDLDYLWHSASAALPGACGSATPTATLVPTATPGPVENLALGRPVTAKGPVVPGFEPQNVVDGRSGTVWYSPHTVSWIYVDLGQARTFNQVRLNWGYPYALRYGIYVWEEGSWRGKLVVDNARGGEDVRTLPFVEARFVML